MQILEQLKTTLYWDFIQNIINIRGQWNSPSSIWEGHHIIPKCLGGTGWPRSKHENIIRLTPSEHFIAHKLLIEALPENEKLAYAFWAMCTLNNGKIISTPEEYQQAKELRNQTIGQQVRSALIGNVAKSETRNNHSKKQTKELNGFYGKKHSEETLAKLAVSGGKPVRCLNTGIEYTSSYEAAEATGIGRVLINRCCKGLQESTKGGWKFEYVNSEDADRSIPGKNTLSKYERRRRIIELRKQVVELDQKFPNILSEEDKLRIKKLATCENYRYLNNLLKLFILDN